MPIGALNPPLGNHRLRLVEFIQVIAQTKFKCVLDALIEAKTILCVIDLFFAYYWNSFLHRSVQELLLFLLGCPHKAVKLHVHFSS